jgi:hypothetical protein
VRDNENINVFSVTDVVVTEGENGSIGKSASELQKVNASCVLTTSVHLIVIQYNTLCGASHRCHAALYHAPNNPSSTQKPKRPRAVSGNKPLTICVPQNTIYIYVFQTVFHVMCFVFSNVWSYTYYTSTRGLTGSYILRADICCLVFICCWTVSFGS